MASSVGIECCLISALLKHDRDGEHIDEVRVRCCATSPDCVSLKVAALHAAPQIKLELPASITQILVTDARPEGAEGSGNLRAYARDLSGAQAARFAPLHASPISWPCRGSANIQTEVSMHPMAWHGATCARLLDSCSPLLACFAEHCRACAR